MSEISTEQLVPSHRPDHRKLVRRLIGAGEKLPSKLRDQILALGSASVPWLIEILVDDDLYPEDSPGDGWAPIHAAKLLGELRATEAVSPMIEGLAKSNYDEIIHDRIMQALEAIGEPALEPLLAAYVANSDREFRSAVSSILAGLTMKDERIFALLLDELTREPDFAASHVAEYGDARAVPALIRAFDEYEPKKDAEHPFVNQGLVELHAAIEDLGGELSEEQEAKYARALKPLDDWRAKFNAVLAERSKRTARSAAPTSQKLGRNDPCKCGSGKKYKKCCLAKDESDRISSPRFIERDGESFVASSDVDDETIDEVAAEFRAQKARGQGPARQMMDFAQPLIEVTGDDIDSMNKAVSLGMLFWNLAVCKDDDAREERLVEAMNASMKTDLERREFRALAESMIERHRTMFPEMHR